MWFALAVAGLPVLDEREDTSVRLLFIGDTGQLPNGKPCSWGDDGVATASCHASAEQREALRTSMRAEKADALYALGDLTYWRGPACRTPQDDDLAKLDAHIGSYLGGLDLPAYLVLGNHDLAQRRRGHRRARCLEAYAEHHPDLELPARQYVVDHGVAQVTVVDTNRPRHLPDLTPESGPWNVVVGHHHIRVAFDKNDLYSRVIEPRVLPWLRTQPTPDLWVNGHAHLLQYGVYDLGQLAGKEPSGTHLPTLVSGAGSKIRRAASCSPERPCVEDDPRGMPAYAASRLGYAVVDITAEKMVVRMNNEAGEVLYETTIER